MKYNYFTQYNSYVKFVLWVASEELHQTLSLNIIRYIFHFRYHHYLEEVISIRIGFIGAGKVGFSLGKYFAEKGLEVSGYYSKSPDSSKEASVFTGTRHFLNIGDLINHSDILFITTPDDEIYNIWLRIKEFNIRGKAICHTSGSLSSNIFSHIEKSDAYAYSIHPIFPISHKYESYKSLKEAWFTIEGHEKYMKDLIGIFKSLGNNILPIKTQDKALYHLASVTVSNIFCGLISRASGYLKEYGFEEKEAIEALYPLIIYNINNIRSLGLTEALTGPVERGDLNTIKNHANSMPAEHVGTYKDLSKDILSLAKEKNPNRDYGKLDEYLEE